MTGRPAHHLVWSGDWTLVRQGFVIDGEAFVMTNWEGLSQGPPLADGWFTLPLVSDDDHNPLQANCLALLNPERPTSCRSDS